MLAGALGGLAANELARANGATPEQGDFAGAAGGWITGGLAYSFLSGVSIGGALGAGAPFIPLAIGTSIAAREGRRTYAYAMAHERARLTQQGRYVLRDFHPRAPWRVIVHDGPHQFITIPWFLHIRQGLINEYERGWEVLIARANDLQSEMRGRRRASPITWRAFENALSVADARLLMLCRGISASIEGHEQQLRREGLDFGQFDDVLPEICRRLLRRR